MKKKTFIIRFAGLVLVLAVSLMLFSGCLLSDILEIADIIINDMENSPSPTEELNIPSPSPEEGNIPTPAPSAKPADSFDLDSVPPYSGKPYVIINNNNPFFTEEEITTVSFEEYYELDKLGRCSGAFASIGKDLMPTEERGSISSVKPTGWHTDKYNFVNGENLFNRCHLIAFSLAGENANWNNLITGTCYMNAQGMEPFESQVVDYVVETNNHVMYRVTPVFKDNELIARGVLMEGWSVEDNGEAICFNIFCYNIQPGIYINYSTGESELEEDAFDGSEVKTYVLNINSYKFHEEDCESLAQTKDKNKQVCQCTREILIESGFEPCKSCNP